MGVTIHYSGTLANPAERQIFLKEAAALAANFGWRIETDAGSGITILPHANSEPLDLIFDENGTAESWVKTQFAGADTHIQIVDFLNQIAPYFSSLTIEDEGEFWETRNPEILQEHFDRITAILDEMRQENPDGRGPLRMENRRIVDFIN